jgi:hypothetical protein
MMATMNCTLNSSVVSVNIPDVLPAVLQMYDSRDLNKYNSMCPTMTDKTFNYDDDFNNSPLHGYRKAGYDEAFVPNGAWHLLGLGETFTPGGSVSGGQTIGDGTPRTTYLQFKTVEPLLCLSPFTYSTESNSQSMYGINNMNFQLNFSGDVSRVLRSTDENVAPGTKRLVSLVDVKDAYIEFNMLNAMPTQILPAKNVLPYLELPRFITAGGKTILAGTTEELTSSTLSLNVIPDKLLIYVRSRADTTSHHPDRFLVIDGINISFNNNAGICSTMSPEQIWQVSRENGVNQNWQQWSGVASTAGALGTAYAPIKIPMQGSIACLQFGKDIALVQDYLASGCVGQYSLQVKVRCHSQGDVAISDAEIVLVCVNSGIVVIERGVSSTYLGILTKEDVLRTSESGEKSGWSQRTRMLGSGLLDQIKTVGKKALRMSLPYIEGSKLGDVAKVARSVVGSGKKGANRFL